MKKTLFALLALATMMPAMTFAEIGNLIVGEGNWTLSGAYSNPYENFTDYTKYSLYLMEKGNSDITSVKTMLEGKTFSEFTTTIASGDSIAFEGYASDWNQLCMNSPAETEFPTTLTPEGNIWGVCVLQDADVVRFQVLRATGVDPDFGDFFYDTDFVAGSGYTSFKSTPAVPEPATATLSLLALAGLCARRRRK